MKVRAIAWGWLLLAASIVTAHEPFDVSWRVMIYENRIEAVSTMGTEGVRELLARGGVSAEQIAESMKARGPEAPTEHPLAVAPLFLQLKDDRGAVKAKGVRTVSEGTEVILTLTFPRPTTENLEVRVTGYATIPRLREGVLIVEDETAGQLDAGMMSAENTTMSVALPKAMPAR